MADRELFWREVLSVLKDRFVSSLTEIQSWEAENLLNSDKKLLSHLQLSVGLAYAISNATGSKSSLITAHTYTYTLMILVAVIHTYIHTYIHTNIHGVAVYRH